MEIDLQNKIKNLEKENQKLKDDLRTYKNLVETDKELSCLHQPDGSYLFVSPSIKIIAGYDPEEIIGKNPYEYFHPNDIKRVQEESHRKALNSDIDNSIEYRFRKKDGDYVWFRTTTDIIKNENGDVINLITKSYNISKEKEQENTIKNLLQTLELSQETAKIGHWTYDLENNVHNWSKQMCKIFEFPEDELSPAAEKILDKLNKDDQAKLIEVLDFAIHHEKEYSIEFKILSKDGSEKIIKSMGFPDYDINGNFKGLFGVTQDITDIVQIRKELVSKEFELNKIIDRLPGAVYQFKINNKGEFSFPFASYQFYDIYDVKSKNEIKSADEIFAKIHPEDIEELKKSIDDSAKKLNTWKSEHRVIIDNKIKWVEGNSQPVKKDNGDIIWYGFISDITEKKEIENKLKESNTLLQGLFDFSPVGLVLNDGETGDFLDANRAILNMLGYSKEEFLKLHYHDITPPGFEEVDAKTFEKVSTEGEFDQFEKEYLRKDGTRINVLLNGALIESYNGKKVIWSVIQDISILKRYEAELKESNALLKGLFDFSPIGLALNDLEKGEFIDGNKALLDMLNYSKEEFRNLSYWDITPKKYEEQESIQLKSLKEKAYYGPYEKEYIRKDGARVPVLLNGSLVVDARGRKLIWSIIQDITIIKDSQEKIVIAKEEAERANRAKSEFLANMSHEIRTPMNSILGFSEILSGMVEDEKQKEFLGIINKSGKTLLSLINDILDLSKIEAGKLDIKITEVNLYDVIDEISVLFSQKCKEKNNDFIVIIEESFPNNIFIDEIRIKQILLNIIGNAVKFTESGFIKVAVTIAKIDKLTIDFSINIIDTGIGISQENLKSIFEAFTQQEKQNTRKYGGTGLGLAITKKLADLLNVKIEVSSVVNKGSIFSLKFNDVKYEENSIERYEDHFENKEFEFEKATILIVDDIDHNRTLVSSYFDGTNLNPMEADSGHAAIEMLNYQNIDLILMDIRMPEMSGIEATKIIKNNRNTNHVPVVALTASALTSDEKDTKHIFDGYLRKPIKKYVLFEELSKHLKTNIIKNESEIEKSGNRTLILNFDNELKSIIKDKYHDLIIESLKIFSIDDISEIVTGLEELAIEKNNAQLKHFSEDLKNAIEHYRIDEVELLFKGLLESID